ncbi:TRNT1 family protein [Megaselia abdita]
MIKLRYLRSMTTAAIPVTKAKSMNNLKARENPVVTKLQSKEFQSLFTPELTKLISVFDKHKFELRIAGGAVRDLLMNIEPKDVDFATTATPTQMKEMFVEEEIRLVNMNGEKHGTITPRINDSVNFEVTTLRVDRVTDGRHAEVDFTTDWLLDSNRRDLTINSMFLGFDGSLYDYFYGFEDLKKRRVVFVGNADSRIKEDYLRILRYFRFYGRIAGSPGNHDKETIEAITENISGLEKISGERIWSELRKILVGNFGLEMMEEMIKCGICKYIRLPESPLNIEEMRRVYGTKQDLQPISYLTALVDSGEEALNIHNRLKLSAFERDLAIFIAENRKFVGTDLKDVSDYKKRCTLHSNRKDFYEELLKYSGETEIYKEFKEWEIPKFPLNGGILKQNKCPSGKVMGAVMSELKAIWAEDNFETSQSDLLSVHLPTVLQKIKINDFPNKKMKTER